MIACSPSVRAFLLLLALFLFVIFLPTPDRTLAFPSEGEELIILTHAGALDTDPKDGREFDANTPSGLEHEALLMFARELGVSARFVFVPKHEIHQRLANHEGHLAAGWLSPIRNDERFLASMPLLGTSDVLVRHEVSLPINNLEQLAGQTVHAVRGSRQLRLLRQLQEHYPDIDVVPFPSDSALDLLGAVARQEVKIALVDSARLSIALNYYPVLEGSLEIGHLHPVVWLFPSDGSQELYNRVQIFLDKLREDKQLVVLYDRYFGHLQRLKPRDITVFISRVERLLPRYQELFKRAQLETDFDWRLLAALSYQESHWDPLNTSYTGVRGMMMLTGETADRMGVSNRLDPRESIMGGARYLVILKSYIPADTPEPDRTWQAIASYNIGPGHFNAARRLAKQLGVDGSSWFEMKKVLPLLARPEYYNRLKSGRARGGEAVIMVENIRLFYDILRHHQPPYVPFPHPSDEAEEARD